MIFTFQDAIDHLIDFVGGGPADQVGRDCRRVIMESYREVVNSHKWPYLYRHGRIITNEPYPLPLLSIDADPPDDLPTIQYQQSDGSYPYQVTLTGGTWPSWAGQGYLRIANDSNDDGTFNYVAYRCAQRISATVLTLDPQINPGGDLSAGTEFVLYQDTYLLPVDFISQDQALYELNFGGMQFVHPREWLFENRYIFAEGVPEMYTITGDPQYPGRLVIRIAPWPQAAKSIDFIYYRRPRPIAIPKFNGAPVFNGVTASISANSNSLTVTSGVFLPAHVGATVRISANNKTPTAIEGSITDGYNPAALEATIVSWVSPTSVVLDTEPSANLTGVAWYLSDPIDVEQGAMLNCYRRCSEKNMAVARNLKDKADAKQRWLYALEQGKAASSPSFKARHSGPRDLYIPRLRDYPKGPDQS